MKIEEILKSLPKTYSAEAEKNLIQQINDLEFPGFVDDLADLLAFAISDGFNILAQIILEKKYQGKRLELKAINQAIINQNNDKYSLLHFSAQFGNKEMLAYFLKNGIEITLGTDKFTPLHSLPFAVNISKETALSIINELLKKDPDILNKRDAYKLTALHYAAYHDNMPVLEALVDKGANG